MKILHLIASVNPVTGGPIEGILRQAEAAGGRDMEREIACLDAADAPWVAASPIKVFALGGASEARRVAAMARFPWLRYGVSFAYVRWLRDNLANYDAVIVNGLWNFTTLGFRLATLGRRVPYVVFTHGMLDPWFRTYRVKHAMKQLFWLFADGPVINGADAVLFTSEEEMLLARGSFWPYRAKERVVAYGSGDVPDEARLQAGAFAAAVPNVAGRRYLLFLSRIHEKKGCDLLVEAFSRVAAAHPELDLVIAGPNQPRLRASLEAQARRAGIAERIHWPGMLSGDAKWGAFRGASAFVLPSHQENFGIVVAEAMACGTPVLISNKVNIWREVEAAGAGLVEPDTAEGTFHLLSRFLAMGSVERQAMSMAARAGYEQHFNARDGANDLLLVLQDVVAGHQ